MRDLKEVEPERVIGIVKITGQDFALVVWTNKKKYYVPYQFLRKQYPNLLISYFQRGCEIVKYSPIYG